MLKSFSFRKISNIQYLLPVFIDRAVRLAAGFASLLIINRSLGKDLFANYVLAILVFNLIDTFASHGCLSYLPGKIASLSQSSNKARQVIDRFIVMRLFSILILTLPAIYLSNNLFLSTVVIQLALLGLCINNFTLFESVMQGLGKADHSAVPKAFIALCFTAVRFLMYLSGVKSLELYFLLQVGENIFYSMACYLILKCTGFYYVTIKNLYTCLKLFKFNFKSNNQSWSSSINNIITYLYMESDKFIAAFLAANYVLGEYYLITRITTYSFGLLSAISMIFSKQLSQRSGPEAKSFHRDITAYRKIFYVSLLFALFIMIISPLYFSMTKISLTSTSFLVLALNSLILPFASIGYICNLRDAYHDRYIHQVFRSVAAIVVLFASIFALISFLPFLIALSLSALLGQIVCCYLSSYFTNKNEFYLQTTALFFRS